MARILIAEDQSVCSTLLELVLQKAGYEVTTVENGQQALDVLNKDSDYDALITDWLMPEMDGIELIRQIRKNIKPPPAILMVTTMATDESKEYALDSGADDFIEKPYEPGQILTALSTCLQRRKKPDWLIKPAPMPSWINNSNNTGNRTGNGSPQPRAASKDILAVGITTNTGGPVALFNFFKALNRFETSPNLAYFVILQAPIWALEVFIMRLQKVTAMPILHAADGSPVEAGTIYVAPRDRHLTIAPAHMKINLTDEAPVNFVRPSADVLFDSMAAAFKDKSIGVVLTGIGYDGAQGCAQIASVGGLVLVQDPASAEAPTQPKTVADLSIPKQVGTVEQLAQHIVDLDQLTTEHSAHDSQGNSNILKGFSAWIS